MKEKNLIAIIGRFQFPTGEAASTRVLTMGKILRSLGHTVVYIGKTLDPEKQDSLQGNYDGFDYYNLVNGGRIIDKVRQLLFSGVLSMNLINEKKLTPNIVIYYGTSSAYLLPFLRYRKKYNFKFITDIVEWYDATHVAGGKYGPNAMDVNYSIKKLIPKSDGVIAISSYLKNYYDDHQLPTVRIPILIDRKNPKWNLNQDSSFDPNNLNLVYAGVPGKKDLMNILIEAIEILVDEGHPIVFHMLGPNNDQIKNILGEKSHLTEKLKENLILYGRVPQNEVPKYVTKADFSVLIRPNKRYAHAGFPTKFVESLASGIPVIANLTSDLNLYLKDGHNGFIIDGFDRDAVVKTLRKVLRLTIHQKKDMKVNAIHEAHQSFDYVKYKETMVAFLNSI